MDLGDWIREVIVAGGYVGLCVLILLENLFPPIPSELILPLAGFLVSAGEFDYGLAVLAATVGSTLGAIVMYELARRGGRPLILRHHRFLRVTDAELDRAEAWFSRYGGWLVLGGRLVPGVRSLVSLPAGLARMRLLRFVLLTVLGSAIWNAALVGAGWVLADRYEEVGSVLGPLSTLVLVALAIVALIGFVRWRRGRR